MTTTMPIILIDNDTVISEFLNAQKKSTRFVYKSMMQKFIEFTKMNGKQIIQSRKLDLQKQTFEWEKKLMEFQTWLIKRAYSETFSKTAVGMARGFFAYYRLPIQLRRQESRKLNQVKRKTEDFLFDREDIAKMSMVGNLKEKYVLLVGKSLGLRVSDFTALTFGNFRTLKLDDEPPISLGEICTQKEKVKAYPFLDSDAVPIVKQLLESNKNKADSEKVLKDTEENLSVILQNLARKSGIEPHGKRIRFHCLRKFLIDRLSAYASETQWKQIVGKQIDEKAYVTSEQLRQIYKRAMKDIVINGSNGLKAKKISELENALAQLEKENIALKTRIEQLQKQIADLTDNQTSFKEALLNIDKRLTTIENKTKKIKEPFEFR